MTATRFILGCFVLVQVVFAYGGSARGEALTISPASWPIYYQHIVRTNPNFSIHIAQVDMTDPRVAVRVARGGPDPDGEGPWSTTLLPTSEIARRENFDLAINGDFFVIPSADEAGGIPPRYTRTTAARPRGWAVTDGQLWQHADSPRPYLAISSSNTAQLVESGPAGAAPPSAVQVMGGGQIIVRAGRAVAFHNAFATSRHPRTVVGLDRTSTRLTFFVVDGRQPALSIGMTLAELSHEMLQLGCHSAINLDGGGSTTLVYRDPSTTDLRVMNSTSDRKERAVANIIGVRISRPKAPGNI